MTVKLPGVETLSFAYGEPLGEVLFKQCPQDFVVVEALHYALSGEGEHLYLQVEKQNANTQDVKVQLAKRFGLPLKSISEAGLKDKHALTRQWISVHWPIKAELPDLNFDSFRILNKDRHQKKLKRGAFGYNEFTITVREVEASHEQIEQRLQSLSTDGFPNYFGKQRFGNNLSNLDNFMSMLSGARLKRHTKALAISAARSFLFNQMLDKLIQDKGWPLSGVTHGLLWGKNNKEINEHMVEVASFVTGKYTQLSEGLEKLDVELGFRHLSVKPNNLAWRWLDDHSLQIQFELPPGCFATAFLRELFTLKEQVCEF